MGLEIGSVVRVLAGHDMGTHYVVVQVLEDGYVWVADGKLKKIDKPKRKKVKHILEIGRIAADLACQLEQRCGVFAQAAGTGDSELRKCLKIERGSPIK